MKIKCFIISILTFASFLPAHAQSYSPQQIELAERLHSLSKNAPPEIAYIQTSKDIYETGEDLWFKVYLLDAQYLVPSLLSKTLYLQLLNETGKKVVWQEKYEIRNGFASGRVYLDSDLPEGDYFLASYSFFNDSTEFKAVRRIKIKTDIISSSTDGIKTGKSKSSFITVEKEDSPVQFRTFPEGGNLISGIKSRLAFKAVNSNGEPLDILGTLFADNTPVVKFKSYHAGMGSFDFTPEAGKKYLIRLTEPSIDSSFILPEIYPAGISMRLTGKDKDFLTFVVSESPGIEQEDIYLRVQCRGIVYGMISAELNKELKIKIPLSGLPQGIAEVTLFNSSLVPVAERLVYVNMDQKLYISAILSGDVYATRGKAALKITVKDQNGNPVIANLGVSIFDNLYKDPLDSVNILTHCYLSADLRGRIYNPSYYFDGSSKERDMALDLLMLTQGWRRYLWDEKTLNKSGEKRQVIFDEISGIINYPHRHKTVPRKQVFVIAFSPNIDNLHALIPADSAGRFTVSADFLKRWETDYVYLKPFGPPGSQLTMHQYDPLSLPEFIIGIKLTDPFEIINSCMKNHDLNYPMFVLKKEYETPGGSYKPGAGLVKIKEVTIKGRKQNIIRGKYLGALDSIAGENDYVCPLGVLNCPRHPPNEPEIITEFHYNPKPQVGHQYLVMYNYNTPAESYRVITYWLHKYSEEDLMKINNLSRIKAYYGPREFYQPDYDKKSDEHIPDFRNTLLWAPSVVTDENGEATLSFYCSDINTNFIGRIEGVGKDGLLGTGYFKFTVRKLKQNP